MHRPFILLLCSLIVSVRVVAAPAPIPKPSKIWFTGWNDLIDPVGDCRLSRDERKLTIHVPIRDNRWIAGSGKDGLTAPHILRDVSGDFAVQVRVTGDFSGGTDPFRSAGLVMKVGEYTCIVHRQGQTMNGTPIHELRAMLLEPLNEVPGTWEGVPHDHRISPRNRTAFLRLERQGDVLVAKVSPDGTEWLELMKDKVPKLPKTVKLGVFAQATSRSAFEPVFDQFELTPPK